MLGQKGERLILDACRTWGLSGYDRWGAQASCPSVNRSNRSTGAPVQPKQEDFSARPKSAGMGFPQVSREDCPWVDATSNAREDLTFRSLSQASRAFDGYMKNFAGLSQSLFHHSLGTKGGSLESKGQERGNYYMDLILWRTA